MASVYLASEIVQDFSKPVFAERFNHTVQPGDCISIKHRGNTWSCVVRAGHEEYDRTNLLPGQFWGCIELQGIDRDGDLWEEAAHLYELLFNSGECSGDKLQSHCNELLQDYLESPAQERLL